MAGGMNRRESDVIEIALNRMVHEEVQFRRLIHDGGKSEDSNLKEGHNCNQCISELLPRLISL
jgi:hypothetical protein